MKSLETYFVQPIPDLGSARQARLTYRDYPLDLQSELAADPAADIRDFDLAGDNFYHRSDNPPYYQSIPGSIREIILRRTVLEKLTGINDILRPRDLELYLYDGYRPIAVQNYFHDVWFYNEVKARHPDWTEPQIWAEVELYWASGAPADDQIDPLSPPPHSTGGSIDLTIRRTTTGEPLFMGTMFDDMTPVSFPEHYETGADLSYSEIEARRNRRLLYWLMIESGFQNNATEWWHFSYGDQMWALFSQTPAAFYSNLRTEK